MSKFLNGDGVLYLWGKIKTYVGSVLPTKVSQLTNDSKFITIDDVPEGTVASNTLPKENGTPNAGSEITFARGDHVHPHDSTKVDKVADKQLSTNDFTTAEKEKLAGIAEGANKYTLPTAGSSLGGVKTTSSVTDVHGYTPVPIVGGVPYYKDTNAPQESVLYTPQILDDTQKAQARSNIDAAPAGELNQLRDDLGEIDNAVFDTTTTEELVNTNPIVEDGKTLYTSTYIAIQEQSNSSIATLTNVVVGETLYISSTVANTTTSWGFTFTDDRNKTIYHYYDESLSGLADKTNIEVTVPEGATKLYVSRLSSKGKPEVFRKKAVKRKTPKSNLIDVLHEKKLVVFGDSMAYGYTIPESVWTKLLAEKHGMILTNFAQNGTTITRKTTTMSGATFLDTDSVHAKVMNNLNNPVEADYIIVFGGTNDIARNDQCPLGTIDDATSQTFYGALNAICQRLIQTYPSGNICFITPYIRNAGLATTEICKQYVTAIHEVCEKFGGIPVFDNTVNGALDFSNSYQVNALTMKDSYHLNEDGHKRAMHKYEVFLQGI